MTLSEISHWPVPTAKYKYSEEKQIAEMYCTWNGETHSLISSPFACFLLLVIYSCVFSATMFGLRIGHKKKEVL